MPRFPCFIAFVVPVHKFYLIGEHDQHDNAYGTMPTAGQMQTSQQTPHTMLTLSNLLGWVPGGMKFCAMIGMSR